MSTHPHPPRELSFGVFDHMDRGRLPLADHHPLLGQVEAGVGDIEALHGWWLAGAD